MILLFSHSPSVIKPSQAMGTGRLNGDRLLYADLWVETVRLFNIHKFEIVKYAIMKFAHL